MRVTLLCAVGLLALASAAGAAKSGGTTVENFTASGTVAVKMPGTATKDGTVFQGRLLFRHLDFSEGHLVVEGSDIELDGVEEPIAALTYTGSAIVPARRGPAMVNAQGSLSATDAAGERLFSLNGITVHGLRTGPQFSERSLDLVKGSVVSASAMRPVPGGGGGGGCVIADLDPDADIDLRVEQLETHASVNLIGVDAVNGLVDFAGMGRIDISDTAGAGKPVPLPTGAGLGLLLLGLGGAFGIGRAARRRVEPATD